MSFWNYGKFVDWEHCIEANRLCNLEMCPETMNCCATNCIGMPTISMVLFILSIVFLIFLVGMILSIRKEKQQRR